MSPSVPRTAEREAGCLECRHTRRSDFINQGSIVLNEKHRTCYPWWSFKLLLFGRRHSTLSLGGRTIIEKLTSKKELQPFTLSFGKKWGFSLETWIKYREWLRGGERHKRAWIDSAPASVSFSYPQSCIQQIQRSQGSNKNFEPWKEGIHFKWLKG